MSSDDLPFADRTVLVTGATEGIGYRTALRLALGGARVIVHGPTDESSATVAERLVAAGAPATGLELVVADFAQLDQVRRLAAELADRHQRLDLLVLNAGIGAPERRTLTEEGNELCFQVNYLAPYLLTRLLERPLARGADSRIVALSSSLHRTANIDWTDLTRAKRYSRISAYGQSKLALTTFVTVLAQWLPQGHTAISVHPGVAETVLTLCSPATQVVNGAYYDQLTPTAPGTQVTEKRSVDRLLKLSEKLTQRVPQSA